MLLMSRPAPAVIPPLSSRHDVIGRRDRSCVREWSGGYEDEGSEQIARGAMAVARDGWWTAALSVPLDAARGALPVTIRLTRLGPDAGQALAAEVLVQVTEREIDAVVALLGGIVAQARRDGVLPAA